MKKKIPNPFQQGYDAGYAVEGFSRPCPTGFGPSDREEWQQGFRLACKDRAAQLEREKRKGANP